MKNEQRGFTLIELVMVIVILGVLAAVAIPKFVDLAGDARLAATQGVAGSLSSASAINYAADLARGQVQGATIASITTGKPGVVDTGGGCVPALGTSFTQAGVTFAASGSGSYNISGGTAPTLIGGTTSCTVTNNDDTTKTATFVLLGAK